MIHKMHFWGFDLGSLHHIRENLVLFWKLGATKPVHQNAWSLEIGKQQRTSEKKNLKDKSWYLNKIKDQIMGQFTTNFTF